MGQRQKTPLTHLLIISCPERAQQGGAALVDLGLGLAEVARVPRIGDLMRMIRVVQQQMDLVFGVAAEDAQHIAAGCVRPCR